MQRRSEPLARVTHAFEAMEWMSSFCCCSVSERGSGGFVKPSCWAMSWSAEGESAFERRVAAERAEMSGVGTRA